MIARVKQCKSKRFYLIAKNTLKIINYVLLFSILICAINILKNISAYFVPLSVKKDHPCTIIEVRFRNNISASFCEKNPDPITFIKGNDKTELPLMIVQEIALNMINKSRLPFEDKYSQIKILNNTVVLTDNISLIPDSENNKGFQSFFTKLMYLGHF